jgi:glutaminase
VAARPRSPVLEAVCWLHSRRSSRRSSSPWRLTAKKIQHSTMHSPCKNNHNGKKIAAAMTRPGNLTAKSRVVLTSRLRRDCCLQCTCPSIY